MQMWETIKIPVWDSGENDGKKLEDGICKVPEDEKRVKSSLYWPQQAAPTRIGRSCGNLRGME